MTLQDLSHSSFMLMSCLSAPQPLTRQKSTKALLPSPLEPQPFIKVEDFKESLLPLPITSAFCYNRWALLLPHLP